MIKRILFFIFQINFIFLVSSALPANTEKYKYQTVPENNKIKNEKELIEMIFRHSDKNLFFTSKAVNLKNQEKIKINMEQDGEFISGIREISKDIEELTRRDEIIRDNDKVYVRSYYNKKKKEKEFKLPKDKLLAVDASLLVLLRSFPFNENKEWEIFMIDFSGYSVTVTVRQVGTERVVVPAGVFECYCIEVVVNFFIIHPKIKYWLTKEEPHFLVKHAGKRGPFTSNYVTSLISME